MDFFRSLFQKTVSATSLMGGFVDVHTHLLPGVDDGVKTMDEAIELMGEMRESGVKRIFCTPHIMSSHDSQRNSSLADVAGKLRERAPAGLDIRLAAEYMLDGRFGERFDEGFVSYNGENLLIEMSYYAISNRLYVDLFSLQTNGFNPIMAHPERYSYMTMEDVKALKARGCRLQLNLTSLAGMYGERVANVSLKYLKAGLYDYLGTDTHSLSGWRRLLSARLPAKADPWLRKLIENNGKL